MTRRLTQGDKRATAAGRRRRCTGVPGARPLRFEALEARQMLTASSSTPAPLSPAQVAQETAIATSINTFAVDLYAVLQQQAGGSGNLLISPISVSACLAMAYAGANGENATQMAQVLDFSGDADATEQAFGTLLTDLNSSTQGTKNTLSIADALWGQQGMQILTPFMQTLQADFGSSMQTLDFVNNPSGAAQTINQWVSQQTQGHITQLFSSGDFNKLTRLVLTNAVYFQGSWATAFDPTLTQNAGFTLASGSQVQVPMMHNTSGDYGYMDSDGFQVLDMPYAGGRFSMDIILPDSGGSASALNVGQLPADLAGWLSNFTALNPQQQVEVSLPKFSLDIGSQLATPLQNLGMTDAFNPGTATTNFPGITNPLVTPLYISTVVQQATIDVDESGTVATAATGAQITSVAIATVPPPLIVFDANHPFLFLIRDDQSGAVLFMGQEMDPTSAAGNPSAPALGSAAAASLHGGHSLGSLGVASQTQGGHNQIVPAGTIGGSSTGGFNYFPPSETPPASGGSSKTGSAGSNGEKSTRVVFTPVETVFSQFDPSEFLFGV